MGVYGTLNPVLELRTSLISIRKLISDHQDALQKGTIVRKAQADPLLSERIDNPCVRTFSFWKWLLPPSRTFRR